MVRRVLFIGAIIAAFGAGACGSHAEDTGDDTPRDTESMSDEELEVYAEQQAEADNEVLPEDDVEDVPEPLSDEPTPEQADDELGAGDPLPNPEDPPPTLDDEGDATGQAGAEHGEQVGTIRSGLSTNAATHPRKVFGLGVDAHVAVRSPDLFNQLRGKWKTGDYSLGAARKVVFTRGPLDSSYCNMDALNCSHFAREQMDAWVKLMDENQLEPFFAISTQDLRIKGRRISTGEFRVAFSSALKHEGFRKVKYWGINEPDLDLKGMYKGEKDSWKKAAKLGVRYLYHATMELRRCRAKHGYDDASAAACNAMRLVAGEFSLEEGNGLEHSEAYWRNYGAFYRAYFHKYLKSERDLPRIWSLHPYADISAEKTLRTEDSGTWKFMQAVRSLGKRLELRDGAFRVWLTETGVLLRRNGTTCGLAGDANGKNDKQYRGAKRVNQFAKFSGIDRVYWWQFREGELVNGGPAWDSALVQRDGDGKTPYPSFYALTNQPLPSIAPVCATGCGGCSP